MASIEGRVFYQGLLETLAHAMGAANGYLFDHGPRTAVLAHALGRRMGLGEVELAHLFFGAVLSDVGMIGLVEDAWERPVQVLPGRAREEVKGHPLRSAAAARGIPFLEGAEEMVRHHHEWWEGSGYPEGLRGDEIPLGARVLRLADTVTALTGSRPQRPRRSPEEVRGAVASESGTEFDPTVARLWIDMDRAGQIPRFHPGVYREIRFHAIDQLVPPQVPVSSVEVLLDLFSTLIDAKDRYTGGHSRRVAILCEKVTQALGLDREVQRHVRAAGYLHDLGKLAVPSRILRKPGSLILSERNLVRQHPAAGARLLQEAPALHHLAPACRYHHERWDGNGYPEGISGERIPVFARIVGVCDSYDAMTSHRAYRRALSHDGAVSEVRTGRGCQFAPEEADALLSLPRGFFDDVRALDAVSGSVSGTTYSRRRELRKGRTVGMS